MGVYAFQWRHLDKHGRAWVKIGHYKGNNAWSRVAHRGFNSCRPGTRCMRGRVSVKDLDLVAWFPGMSRRDEGAIHRAYKDARTGEWYPEDIARAIIKALVAEHVNQAAKCDKKAAMATRRRL